MGKHIIVVYSEYWTTNLNDFVQYSCTMNAMQYLSLKGLRFKTYMWKTVFTCMKLFLRKHTRDKTLFLQNAYDDIPGMTQAVIELIVVQLYAHSSWNYSIGPTVAFPFCKEITQSLKENRIRYRVVLLSN